MTPQQLDILKQFTINQWVVDFEEEKWSFIVQIIQKILSLFLLAAPKEGGVFTLPDCCRREPLSRSSGPGGSSRWALTPLQTADLPAGITSASHCAGQCRVWLRPGAPDHAQHQHLPGAAVPVEMYTEDWEQTPLSPYWGNIPRPWRRRQDTENPDWHWPGDSAASVTM